MNLTVTEQIHISSVQADTLRPGQTIEVSDALGKELRDRQPGAFAPEGAGGKAEAAPANKSEGGAPSNKANAGRKTKGG